MATQITRTTNLYFMEGTEDPNGTVTGTRASVFFRRLAGSVGWYINTDGATTWLLIGTSGAGGGWTDDGTNVRLTDPTDTVSVGTSTAPLGGIKMNVLLDDATTNGVSVPLAVDHTTTGTPAAGIGAGIQLRAENSAGSIVAAAQINGTFSTVTSGAEVSQLEIGTRTGGGAITSRWRIDGSGNLIMLGNVSVLPLTDSQGAVGTAAQRFSSVSSIVHVTYAAASDAQAAMQLDSQALEFGAGGASVRDIKVGRSAANTMQLTATTVVPFADGSDFGTSTNRYDVFMREVWSLPREIAFADSPYTVAAGDNVIFVNTSGGAVTINLPAVAGARGRMLTIKKRTGDANAITLDPNGAETIDGAATQAIPGGSRGWATVIAPTTGTDWAVIS